MTVASTTSFTVVPNVRLIFFTSSSGRCVNAIRRCGEIVRLNEVLGARSGAGIPSPDRLFANTRFVIERMVEGTTVSHCIGRRVRASSARPMSSSSDGLCSGSHSSSGGGFCSVGSGSRSKKCTIMFAPETPSIVQ